MNAIDAGGAEAQSIKTAALEDHRLEDAGHTSSSTKSQDVERYTVPLRGYRKAMVHTMTAAGRIPTFHLCDDVSMDAVMQVRDRARKLQNTTEPLTVLPFLVKALSLALIEHPEVNARLSSDLSSLEVIRCAPG
jgi:pyruvate/2-oxoglutarate dehydrogenase complex dihydrolipoamide acyltransferase (E2) component